MISGNLSIAIEICDLGSTQGGSTLTAMYWLRNVGKCVCASLSSFVNAESNCPPFKRTE